MTIQPSGDFPLPGVGGLLRGVEAAASGAILIAFVAVGYTLLTLDRRREGSPNRDDTQIGLKLVLWGVVVAGVMVAAGGLEELLAFVLGGFKGGWKAMRGPIAAVAAGVLPAGAVWKLMLPRCNGAERPQVERLALGLIAVLTAATMMVGLNGFLAALLAGAPWATIASQLAKLGVWGGLGVLAATRLGLMSGWRAMPPRMPMAPPMAPPMQGTPGMPPLGGGYPPQGGYPPPQGGGYPPQGGGYPPQGGGGGWPQQ